MSITQKQQHDHARRELEERGESLAQVDHLEDDWIAHLNRALASLPDRPYDDPRIGWCERHRDADRCRPWDRHNAGWTGRHSPTEGVDGP